MKSSQFDFWPILGKLVTRKKTIFPNRIEVSQPHWSCRGWTSNSRCAVCFEISRRQRGTGTSSGSIIALCTISTWRYRVCRLLQRDESGRWNVRLANSVPPPMATRRCRCYRGSYTRAKATGLFESDINDDRSCVSRGFLFFFFLFSISIVFTIRLILLYPHALHDANWKVYEVCSLQVRSGNFHRIFKYRCILFRDVHWISVEYREAKIRQYWFWLGKRKRGRSLELNFVNRWRADKEYWMLTGMLTSLSLCSLNTASKRVVSLKVTRLSLLKRNFN